MRRAVLFHLVDGFNLRRFDLGLVLWLQYAGKNFAINVFLRPLLPHWSSRSHVAAYDIRRATVLSEMSENWAGIRPMFEGIRTMENF
jgi:hypothetical protein